MAIEYRTQPLAEGIVIPSQIGVGEAQVFQPVVPQTIDLAGAMEKRLQREEVQRKGDVAFMDKMFEQKIKVLPGHGTTYLLRGDELRNRFAENIHEIKRDPLKRAEIDKEIAEHHQIGKVSAAIWDLQKDITKKQVAGEKYSEEDLNTLEELGKEAKDLDLQGVIELYEKVRNITPQPEPVDVLGYQSKIRNLVDVKLVDLKPTINEAGEWAYKQGMNEKEYRKRYDDQSDVAWVSDAQIMQEYPADSTTPEGEPYSKKWRDTMWGTRKMPKLKTTIRKPKTEKKSAFTIFGNKAQTGKYTWTRTTQNLPKIELIQFSGGAGVVVGAKLVPEERIEINRIGGRKNDIMSVKQFDAPDHEIHARPEYLYKDKGKWYIKVQISNLRATETFVKKNPDYVVGEIVEEEVSAALPYDEYRTALNTWSRRTNDTEGYDLWEHLGTSKAEKTTGKISKYVGQTFIKNSGATLSHDELKTYSDEKIDEYIKKGILKIQ